MKATSAPSRSRLLVAIAVLAVTMLACAAAGAPTPAKHPTVAIPTAAKGTPLPRTIPTLVPTYTRLPSLTPTSTPTSTPTRTPTATASATRTPTSTRTVTATREAQPTTAGGAGSSTGARPGQVVCPPPQSRTDLRNKIIFKTDRENDPDTMYAGDVYAVYVMEPDGSNQRPLSESTACGYTTWEYFQKRLSVSNDGLWFLLVEKAGSGTSIFLRGSAGQLVRRVTTLDGNNYDPAWAPDQARLAFVSQVDMDDEIYTVSIDGTKTRRLTFNTWHDGFGWDKHPTWSVDGRQIAFWSNRETGRQQIWVMRDDGQGQRNLSNSAFNDWDPIWVNP